MRSPSGVIVPIFQIVYGRISSRCKVPENKVRIDSEFLWGPKIGSCNSLHIVSQNNYHFPTDKKRYFFLKTKLCSLKATPVVKLFPKASVSWFSLDCYALLRKREEADNQSPTSYWWYKTHTHTQNTINVEAINVTVQYIKGITYIICTFCSVSRWRPQKVDKRMVLEYTHGLFIT
jgi:hypothetical protein